MAKPTDEHFDPMSHVVPVSLYVTIWAALMVFTALTVFAATLELHVFNIVLALLIATVKGTLVVLFFMHLRYSTKLTMVTVVAAIAQHDGLPDAGLGHQHPLKAPRAQSRGFVVDPPAPPGASGKPACLTLWYKAALRPSICHIVGHGKASHARIPREISLPSFIIL
jgi:caa(3)-type oxidase subunit IV